MNQPGMAVTEWEIFTYTFRNLSLPCFSFLLSRKTRRSWTRKTFSKFRHLIDLRILGLLPFVSFFFMNANRIVFTLIFLCYSTKDVSGHIALTIYPLLTICIGCGMTVYLTAVDPTGSFELFYSLPILLMSLLSFIKLCVDTVTYTTTTHKRISKIVLLI